MEEKKTYAVFWMHKFYNEWTRYGVWLDEIESAEKILEKVAQNPRCAMVKIVERTESFKDVRVSRDQDLQCLRERI